MVDYEALARALTKWLKSHKLFLGKVEGPQSQNGIRGFIPVGEREIAIQDVYTREVERGVEYKAQRIPPIELDEVLKEELHFHKGDLHFAVRVFPEYAREEVIVSELGNPENTFRMLGDPRVYFRIFLYKQQQQ